MPHPRGELIAKHKGQERRQQFNVAPGPYDFLIPMLHEAGGLDRRDTMGGTIFMPLKWAELHAWAQATRRDIAPCWFQEIRNLSSAFARQLNASREMNCQAPFDPEGDI